MKPLVDLFGEELFDLCEDDGTLRIGVALALPKPIPTILFGVDELFGLDEGDLEVTCGTRIFLQDDIDVLLELVRQALL